MVRPLRPAQPTAPSPPSATAHGAATCSSPFLSPHPAFQMFSPLPGVLSLCPPPRALCLPSSYEGSGLLTCRRLQEAPPNDLASGCETTTKEKIGPERAEQCWGNAGHSCRERWPSISSQVRPHGDTTVDTSPQLPSVQRGFSRKISS